MLRVVSRENEFIAFDKNFVNIHILFPASNVISTHPFIDGGIIHSLFKSEPDISFLLPAIPCSFKCLLCFPHRIGGLAKAVVSRQQKKSKQEYASAVNTGINFQEIQILFYIFSELRKQLGLFKKQKPNQLAPNSTSKSYSLLIINSMLLS